jgi:hypothetical protein
MATISDLIRTEARAKGLFIPSPEPLDEPNRDNAVRILESWLDNNDPTAEYYVKSIPPLNRAVSYQRFNDKEYVCVLAKLGGRIANEPFLVPRAFWDDMEREINPPAKTPKDSYPDFEI